MTPPPPVASPGGGGAMPPSPPPPPLPQLRQVLEQADLVLASQWPGICDVPSAMAEHVAEPMLSMQHSRSGHVRTRQEHEHQGAVQRASLTHDGTTIPLTQAGALDRAAFSDWFDR